MVLPNVAGPVIRPGMRAAGLSRLSRETQETTSPERQRSLHLRLARNYELHYDPRPYADGGDLYEDIDFSAYNLRRPRPAFENLMRRLDQYDVILIWALHRLVRRTVELIRVMDTCKAHNVVIITENGPLDWFSPHGEFTTTMWAGLAQMESANISNRVKAVKRLIESSAVNPSGPSAETSPDGGSKRAARRSKPGTTPHGGTARHSASSSVHRSSSASTSPEEPRRSTAVVESSASSHPGS